MNFIHKHKFLLILSIVILLVLIRLAIVGDFFSFTSVSVQRFTVNEFSQKVGKKDSFLLKEFIEETIEVEGVLKEITSKYGSTSLLLEGKESELLVLCEMKKNQNTSHLKVGTIVSVKGTFKGILHDAIMLNCILIDNETYE